MGCRKKNAASFGVRSFHFTIKPPFLPRLIAGESSGLPLKSDAKKFHPLPIHSPGSASGGRRLPLRWGTLLGGGKMKEKQDRGRTCFMQPEDTVRWEIREGA